MRASVAKGKRSRRDPLDDEMMAMLDELREQAASRPEGWDREHVFVNRNGNPHRNNSARAVLRHLQAGGNRGRRTQRFGGPARAAHHVHTLSIEDGASPKAVQTIVGHATLDMTMRGLRQGNGPVEAGRDQCACRSPRSSTPGHIVSIETSGRHCHRIPTIAKTAIRMRGFEAAKVLTEMDFSKRRGRDSNPQPPDRQSGTLTN